MKMGLAALAALTAMPAAAATITVAPGRDAQERLQTALIDAKAGDTVLIKAGRYALSDGLSLDVDGVTVRGEGPDRTVLDFTGQKGEGEGLLVTSDNVLLRDFAVENSKGNGIKSKGSEGISFVNLRVEWTGGPKASNGAYGVYPVSSANVLIDRNFVRGASDAGIYVGQSRNIIIKNSRAEQNVAGIEIENSVSADVFDNVTTHNTGGILVFDLPDLPVMGGNTVRVFNNKVLNNDTPNFAPPGNIVAGVPMGTGIMVMANKNVWVTNNTIDGNASAAVMIVAYRSSFTDTRYNPLPRDVVVKGNTFGKNGFAPAFDGGAQIAAALGGTLPPVVWDGVLRFTNPAGVDVEVDGGMFVNQGPMVDLQLGKQGTPLSNAQPRLVQEFTPLTLTAPPAVVLPPAQLARAQ